MTDALSVVSMSFIATSPTGLPWWGAEMVTTLATRSGRRLATTRASRPPCEWPMMFTLEAPVSSRKSCTAASSSAPRASELLNGSTAGVSTTSPWAARWALTL